MKKIKKLPLFKIIVIILLLWILLIAYSAKNTSEKALTAARVARTYSIEASSYAQDSLSQSQTNESMIEDICLELGILCR